jgi:hypothetical protein
MSDEALVSYPLPPGHALYGVRTEVIKHEDDRGLLPSDVQFWLPPDIPKGIVGAKCGELHFQNGPIGECGVNGIGIEHLLHLVAARLRGYQETEFRCRENALALTKVEEALHWLQHRTTDRQSRGVEGTSKQ